MSSSRRTRMAANRERAAAFFQLIVAEGKCFTWRDDAGVIPWIDVHGMTLLPLWPDEASAHAENSAPDPGEKLLERRLDELPTALRRLRDSGIAIAVHPLDGNIAATYLPQEFAARLLEAIPVAERGTAEWIKDLAGLVRVLP